MIEISINVNQPKPKESEFEMSEILQFEDVENPQVLGPNQQPLQHNPLQQQNLNHLKDYVPQNMFNEIISHQDVDFDTLMLNEAIRLSQIQENEMTKSSGTFIDTSDFVIDLTQDEDEIQNLQTSNLVQTEAPVQYVQYPQMDESIEELTEEEQIAFAIALSLRVE
jgi:hypothetical protein